MLSAYQYVPHAMEKMQAYIDFIFYQVWCMAPIGLEFSPDLFEAEPDLKEIMSCFGFSAKAPERGRQFYNDIKGIYELFAVLSPQQTDQMKQWCRANNDIEKICANDPALQIARYADLRALHPDLSDQLAMFFKGLYSQQLLDLAALREKIGLIADHYHAFMLVNGTGKCPFCGLIDIKGVNRSKRDAYDHYLPKALYPFNTINFRNLAPTCHDCNSTCKHSKDPAHNATGRRKAFYPYADICHAIEITIDLDSPDIDRLEPANIQLTFGPSTVHEEIETWREVYGIDERYKDKCCSSDAKDWLEQVRILHDHGMEPETLLTTLQQQTRNDPTANSNFLKTAFLEGCKKIGVFDEIKKTSGIPST
ncbi:MAG: hypothetical protein A2277_03415 [Desulfobacterales bacterium RIFOXYA12_FULL_46_15]|nr:MAG: hypothetical protein A2097_03770 [Desulfobacula sp. GWF2_41_7]OGR27389.1 MAG: hypothetical protein A2277_03415 [Desulfobacterales bacterium RIFOXYA12_FULL_46_15]